MTIYALSSGPGTSGIAVIRVSGKNTKDVIRYLTNKELPRPRVATKTKFLKKQNNQIIRSTLSWKIGLASEELALALVQNLTSSR